MHYLGRFDSREFKTVTNLKPDFCEKIYQDNLKVREMLDYFKMWKSVNDAWLELSEWAMNAQIDGSNLLSQQQKAESLVRGYLTEFKITLEHVESKIKKDYTDNSDIYRAFKQATHAAYDGCSEYAFTCQLRNCVEHEKEVVHGFNGCLGCKISCNKKILLTTNSRWKKKDVCLWIIIQEMILIYLIYFKNRLMHFKKL